MIYENIKKQIIKRSKQHFNNINALETAAGVSQGVIRNILKGKSKNPGVVLVVAISKALKCSVSDLLEDELDLEHTDVNRTFDSELYNNACSAVVPLCVGKGISHLEDMLLLIKKVYCNSFDKNEKTIDYSFVEGLIDGYLEKSSKRSISKNENMTTPLKEKTPTPS